MKFKLRQTNITIDVSGRDLAPPEAGWRAVLGLKPFYYWNTSKEHFDVWYQNPAGPPLESVTCEALLDWWDWTCLHDKSWNMALQQVTSGHSWTDDQKIRLFRSGPLSLRAWIVRQWNLLYMDPLLPEIKADIETSVREDMMIDAIRDSKVPLLVELILQQEPWSWLRRLARRNRQWLVDELLRSDAAAALARIEKLKPDDLVVRSFVALAIQGFDRLIETIPVECFSERILQLLPKQLEPRHSLVIGRWIDKALIQKQLQIVEFGTQDPAVVHCFGLAKLLDWAVALIDRDTKFHTIVREAFIRSANEHTEPLLRSDDDMRWFERRCGNVEMCYRLWPLIRTQVSDRSRLYRTMVKTIKRNWVSFAQQIMPPDFDPKWFDDVVTAPDAWEMATVACRHRHTRLRVWALDWIVNRCVMLDRIPKGRDIDFLTILKSSSDLSPDATAQVLCCILHVPEWRRRLSSTGFARQLIPYVRIDNITRCFLLLPRDTDMSLRRHCCEVFWEHRNIFIPNSPKKKARIEMLTDEPCAKKAKCS